MAVVAIFILGFFMRLLQLNYLGEIEVDGAFIATLARDISSGESFFRPINPPFYSYLIAVASSMVNDFELAGRWVSVFLGSGLLVLIYIMGRYFFDHKVGLIAMFLAALEPSLIYYSYTVLSETTYLFIFLSALILSFLLLKNKNILLAVFTGLIWGVAFLTRQEGAVYLGIVMLLFFSGMVTKKIQLIRGWMVLLFLLVGFTCAAFPYLQFIKETTGSWALSDKSVIHFRSGVESVHPTDRMAVEKFLFGLVPEKNEVISQKVLTDDLLKEQYKPTFKELASTYFKNIGLCLKLGLPKWLSPLIYLFLALGLYFLYQDREKRMKWLWLLPILPCYLIFPFIYYQNRFLLTLIPFCLILAAYGLSVFSVKVFKKEGVVWLLALTLGFSLVPKTVSAMKQRAGTSDLAREVGGWLQGRFPEGGRFISRYPAIPFYGGGESVAFPYAEVADLLVYAQAQKADTLILRRKTLKRFRPWLLPLFDDHKRFPQFELLFQARVTEGGIRDEVKVFGFDHKKAGL